MLPLYFLFFFKLLCSVLYIVTSTSLKRIYAAVFYICLLRFSSYLSCCYFTTDSACISPIKVKRFAILLNFLFISECKLTECSN